MQPLKTDRFRITVEVVPPAGADTEPLLTALQSLQGLPIDGFSVATNPVAEGIANAREVLNLARERFAGACLMPPFDRYETLGDMMGEV